VSIVLAPGRARVEPDRATMLLTMTAGVALAEAVEAMTSLRVDIKWPNDLMVSGRKLGGILAEAVPSGRPGARRALNIVLGYGINIGPMAYPPGLADRAISLESELGRSIDRGAMCVETLVALARRYADLLSGRFDAILDAWRERAPTSRGARVAWNTPEGPRSGVTAGVDDHGALLVHAGSRVERIVAGEVVWIEPRTSNVCF
jgi:BirA family biotin operon repressor/biotin-[acetyl-CoA-carboxylase] ligase